MNQNTDNKSLNSTQILGTLKYSKQWTLLFGALFCAFSIFGQGFQHVEPPSWWLGMPSDTLDILIHQEDISANKTKIQTHGSGVILNSVINFENPNYIALQVVISNDAQPQTFKIKSKGNAGAFTYNFVLNNRTEHDRGLNQSDIIYLITPDRFANGDSSNDSFDSMTQVGVNRTEPYDRHGGDIKGITDHLDYIQDLGITTLWPNPLLENDQPHESYHGYAFTDSYKIDARFGSNDDYKNLSDSLHARKMKLIQDVVYNHIGNEHHLFTDCPDSSWFNFWDEFSRTNYRAPSLMDPYASEADKKIMTDGWFDKHMPDLNQRNKNVATYLIQQTLWWIEEYQIDALRIDTYAYPDQEFMQNWAQKVKHAYPDIFLFAETWVHGPTVQGWFVDGGLAPVPNGIDAVTDFQVYYSINDALTKDQGWADGLSKLYYTLSADYIYDHPQDMVTFVDNHDLARFLGYVNGDIRKLKIGLGMLMTLRGIPSLYYGTEILMKATNGHGLIREDFPGGWPNDSINKFDPSQRTIQENEIYDYIKQLATLRKNEPAIQNGKLTQFVPVDGVYVYFRESENKTFMVVSNCTEKEKQLTTDRFKECIKDATNGNTLYGQKVSLRMDMILPPFSIQILKLE